MKIFLHGKSLKVSHGFIFVEWGNPYLHATTQKLRDDTDVIDSLVIGKSIPTIPERA
jgi:hypothetical protein